MADDKGGSPDFFDDMDALNAPFEDATPSEGAAEPMAESEEGFLDGFGETEAAEPMAELLDGLGETEAAEAAETAAEPEEAAEEVEKQPSKLPFYLELAGAIGIPLLLLALALLNVLSFSTAVYLIAIGFIPYGIWKGRETSNVYTVILACALAALLTAVYCLWLEWGRYQFDVKARGAKQQASVRQTLQGSAAITVIASLR